MTKHHVILPGLTIALNDPDIKSIKKFLSFPSDFKRHTLEKNYPIYEFFNEAGTDVDEWLELAIDSWLTNEGKYVDSDIVNEFRVNMTAVLTLIKQLQELDVKYPPAYPRSRKSRFVKSR